MTDTRKNESPARSDAYWRADDDRNLRFTLYVKRRARAEADPWHNFGTVYGAGLFPSRKAENVVTPMGLSVLDEIEQMVGLPSPAPVTDRQGRPAPELRREINEHNRFFREEFDREPDPPWYSIEAGREQAAPKSDRGPKRPRRSREQEGGRGL